MKLLYTVLFALGLGELEASSSNSINITTLSQLTKYYNTELNLLVRDTCVKLKNMSENILKDETVQQAKTPLTTEFIKNITEFRDTYSLYKRYDLYYDLLPVFSNTMRPYYTQALPANEDTLFIYKLIEKHGYGEIMREYVSKYVKFISEQFLIKLEEFKNHTAQNPTQQLQKLFKWAEEIKLCEEYECFYNHINNWNKSFLTPREQFFTYVDDQLAKLAIYYGHNVFHIVKAVVQDKTLMELPEDLRQKLLDNISDFINKYEVNHDVDDLVELLKTFYKNVILQLYSNSSDHISVKERRLIQNIFDEHGYEEFDMKYKKKFNDFLQGGIVKKFEDFRASLSQEELSNEKPLLDWFDKFKSFKSINDKNDSFDILYEIMYEK